VSVSAACKDCRPTDAKIIELPRHAARPRGVCGRRHGRGREPRSFDEFADGRVQGLYSADEVEIHGAEEIPGKSVPLFRTKCKWGARKVRASSSSSSL
jgi:hypothetical protein